MGRFGLAVGRFGHTENLWAVLVWAVLVHGPFWSFSVSMCINERILKIDKRPVSRPNEVTCMNPVGGLVFNELYSVYKLPPSPYLLHDKNDSNIGRCQT